MGRNYKIDREFALAVGKRLTALRKEKNLTQAEASEQMGVERTLLVQWENGVRTPDVDSWITLASFYGVSTDYIAGTSIHKEFKSFATSDKLDIDRLNDVGKSLLFDYYHMLLENDFTKKNC